MRAAAEDPVCHQLPPPNRILRRCALGRENLRRKEVDAELLRQPVEETGAPAAEDAAAIVQERATSAAAVVARAEVPEAFRVAYYRGYFLKWGTRSLPRC